MAALVIVDMQGNFSDAANECVAQVIKLAQKAMRLRSTIVLVELTASIHGKTMFQIKEAVDGYKKMILVEKDEQDGSRQVQNAFSETKIGRLTKLDKIRVCGVYANHCVKSTAQGLAEKYPKSQVIIHYEATCGSSQKQQAFDHIDWNWLNYNKPENLYFSKNNRVFHYKNVLKKVS